MINNMMYCTYLTVYKGNKLPPFYIGYSTVVKINSGYCGSVSSKQYKSIWKQELKENSQLFKTKIISIHANKEDAKTKEELLQRKMNVIHNEMYINKAIGHHYDNTGNKHKEETKTKLSIIRKQLFEFGWEHPSKGSKRPGIGGVKKKNIPWNKGKQTSPRSEEAKRKTSESLKETLKRTGIWNKGVKIGPRKNKKITKWFNDPITGQKAKFEIGAQPKNWSLGMGKRFKGDKI